MKKLLILGHVWPESKSSAAGSRMIQLIDLFKEFDFEITFASAATNWEFSDNIKQLDIKTVKIELNSSEFDVFIKNLNPDIILFDRFMIEEQFGWRCTKMCPDAIKVLDTEDLHCLRIARKLAIFENRDFVVDDLYSDIAKREIASILRCDLSLLVSEVEMEILHNQFEVSRELLFYIPIFGFKSPHVPNFIERQDFIFIGNFLHEPNWDCVNYLSSVIWPLIHKEFKNAKLLVYGAYATQKVLELHNPSCNFLIKGRAISALDVVKNARVMLAPLRFGAGIKGKLLEAMQVGTPSVTSSIGAESMSGDLNWNGFITDNPHEFANAALSLYNNEEFWFKAQQNGFEIIKKRYTKAAFESDFFKRIESIFLDLKGHRTRNFLGAILQHHSMASTKYLSKWIEEKNKNQN